MLSMNNLMIRTRYLIALLLILCGSNFVYGQDTTLSVYNNQTEIKAYGSITLLPGFTIPAGRTVRIYIPTINFVKVDQFRGIPSTDQNYISTKTFKVEGILTDADVTGSRNTNEVMQTVNYFDGLGRQSQNVITQGSPNFRDIVTPVIYDAFGRENVKYQAYAAPTGTYGNYRSSAISNQGSYYSNPDAGVKASDNPYSISVFESSPLNRILEQGAPGAAWQPATGHTLKTDYAANTSTDAVKLWTTNGSGATTISSYADGKLTKTIVKNENVTSLADKSGIAEEFKDTEGQVVLKRVWESNTKSLSTYYLYDDLGNLRYVLPPVVAINDISSFTEVDVLFKNYVYGYHYDQRNRVVEKKIPGKGWEHLVYNKLDQLVFSQDSIQRLNQQQNFFKYDGLGRVIMSGVEDGHTRSRVNLQTTVDAQTSILWEVPQAGGYNGYSNNVIPTDTTMMHVHLINYYDTYNFAGNTFGGPESNRGYVDGRQVRGLLTGSKTSVLGGARLLTVYYYDSEGRMVQSKSQNHLGGTDILTNTYNFTGELVASVRQHTKSGSIETIVATSYQYDHQGRKIATLQRINNQAQVVLSKLDYNELGQLLRKNLHSVNNGASFLQKTEFSYNEREWLKNLVSPEFSESLSYENGTYPQWSGNIANQYWGKGSNLPNVFTYTYDVLNRLTSGSSTVVGMSESIAYDEIGNITHLSRGGSVAGSYNYTGNQLTSIANGPLATGGYAYDANGNTVTDGRNGVALTYNYLNLPENVSKTGLAINYVYDASGKKLRKSSNTGGTTDYIDGIHYIDGVLDFIQTSEGVARNNAGTYSYEYNIADHLGNVRYSFKQDAGNGSLQSLQEVNYFPFGLKNVVSAGTNKYLYNGKELQEELEEFDYGARFYDPVNGRWNVLDPLAENHTSITPYNYVMNNPILYGDEFGLDTTKKATQLKEVVVRSVFNAPTSVLRPGTPFNWNNIDYQAAQNAAGIGTRNTLIFAGEQVALSLIPWGRIGRVGKAGLSLLIRGGETAAPEVLSLGAQKMLKILYTGHAWGKVAANGAETEVRSIMSKVLQEGVEMSYGNAAMGSGSKIMIYNGEIVQVVTNQVAGKTVVSNAWVITDPVYKWRALKTLSNIK